jgi:hypothetical protein
LLIWHAILPMIWRALRIVARNALST